MSLTFKHFDTRLNQWIEDPFAQTGILTETLNNILLEVYFPGVEFSFGHLDEKSTAEDLCNHPLGDILLLSSKSRLLYGPQQCLETIEKLCPDRKDRGAYGSIFLGACNRAITEKIILLVVDDETGENGGILADEIAWRQVGDCHGKISPELAIKLGETLENVIQHRLAIPSQYRLAKGTFAPKDLTQLPYLGTNTPKLDLIIPTSSFKGGDKENNPIQTGLHQVTVWIGEKERSQTGKIAISQAHASFPEGIGDLLPTLEDQAYQLRNIQDNHRKLAEYYCYKYEQRRQEELANNQDSQPQKDAAANNNHLMYRLIKADLEGYGQLLETQKVTNELKRFINHQWRDVAIGKTIEFRRGMIIPSKDLKHGEICVPQFPEGEEVINFRSPLLNSNGLCISKNVYVADAFAPNGKPLEGVIVVNDEDKARIEARIKALKQQSLEIDEIVPLETETERQGRDFDGDTLAVELARKYPKITAEIKQRNQPENAYAPIQKEKKVSFYREDGSQPTFEEIAIFMSDGISVGVINNHATALEALESEIDILKKHGNLERQAAYLQEVGQHYQKLIERENHPDKPQPIKPEYRERIIKVASLAAASLTPESLAEAMSINRSIYHDMIGEACYQNQLAVDIFKSNRPPDMSVVEENNRLLHRLPEYIRQKKNKGVYLDSAIATSGFSPVELTIAQINKIFRESQLKARVTEQFSHLFPENYTAWQKMRALAAKKQFDRLFNLATAQSKRLQTESGPVLQVKTNRGISLEITNLNRFNHPHSYTASRLNLKLIANRFPSQGMPHQLIALAEVKGEVDEQGKPVYKALGTVSEQSRQQLQLTAGATTNDAEVKLVAPLTDRQVRLFFHKAYQFASDFYQSIPEAEKLAMAAATWHLCTTSERQSSLQANQKISNFVFATFPEEIIGQLNQFQFTELQAIGISREGNQLRDEIWNQGQTVNIEIRARDDLPTTDYRYGKKLFFVEDRELGKYQEFGVVNLRGFQLPEETKFQGNISADAIATANLHLEGIRAPIKFGKLNHFAWAGHHFQGEEVKVTIEQYQPPPVPIIKLEGKVIGELDSDSVKLLKDAKQLSQGNGLKVTLNTYGRERSLGLYTLATVDEAASKENQTLTTPRTQHPKPSPHQKAEAKSLTLRINRQALTGDFKQHRFNGEIATVTVDFKQAKAGLAVKIKDKIAGMFTPNQNASKNALMRAFAKSNPSQLHGLSFQAKISSNVTIASVSILPDTMVFPAHQSEENLEQSGAILGKGIKFTGEGRQEARGKRQEGNTKTSSYDGFKCKNQREITADFLLKSLKKLPSLAFEYTQAGEPIWGLSVDDQVAGATAEWLDSAGVQFTRISPHELTIEPETRRGYAVFTINKDAISPVVGGVIEQICGEVLDANIKLSGDLSLSAYHQRLESIPKLSNRRWEIFQAKMASEVHELKEAEGEKSRGAEGLRGVEVGVASSWDGKDSRGAGSWELGEVFEITNNQNHPANMQHLGVEPINLYTDGSCLGNPGKGGWAYIIEQTSKPSLEAYGASLDSTNNRMELTAVIKGMEAIRQESPDAAVKVVTDSSYVVNTINKGWKRKANQDLWEKLDALLGEGVVFEWVKGHSQHPQNERCDKMARAAAQEQKGVASSWDGEDSRGVGLGRGEGFKITNHQNHPTNMQRQQKNSLVLDSSQSSPTNGNLAPLNNPLVNLKPLNPAVIPHTKKDIAMAEVATQFIGESAAPSDTPSSTRNYERAWGNRANTGVYSQEDLIMVSGSGPWRGVTTEQIQATFEEHYQPLLDKAIASGSSFVVGNASGTDQLVQSYLKHQGYKLRATSDNYIRCEPTLVAVASDDEINNSSANQQHQKEVTRKLWERKMLTSAMNSLSVNQANDGDEIQTATFADSRYRAIHHLPTDTLYVLDENQPPRGVIYQVKRGELATIDKLTKLEKDRWENLAQVSPKINQGSEKEVIL